MTLNNNDFDADAEDFLGDDEAADPLAPIVLELRPEVCGERLDKVISRLVPQFSRGRLQMWIEDGFVTVDGKPTKVRATVYGDEKVVILPQPDQDAEAYKAEAMALNIVFEDAHLIVVNKPAGLVVHPGSGNWSGTLLNGLLHHCPQLKGVPRAGIVHRLDKDTSGLMVVGKTLAAQTELVRQLQARTVKREYWCLVWGTPQRTGTINLSMGRHPRDRVKMAVSTAMGAKPAITRFEKIETGKLEDRPASLVQCRLETGRTHQIRVHLSHIGFPLIGDQVYGKPHLTHFFPRQALQARRLGLVHPATGEACEWRVPLADDFAELLELCGIANPGLNDVGAEDEEVSYDYDFGDDDDDDDEHEVEIIR